MYKMEVTRIVDHTPQIRELFIRTSTPDRFQFAAGQFVTLHVPTATGKAAMRAYSIASDDRDQQGFQLIFKAVEGGVATNFVWGLQEGAILDFTGPFGRVLFKKPPTEQVVFLNTGSGVSQHFCYLASNAETFPNIRYRMLFGVRFEHDVYYQDELARLATKFTDFKFEYVLSRPGPNWRGKSGYVQNFIEEYDYLKTPTTFYLCGNGAMIKDVKLMLEAKGFDKTRIFSEAFD